MSCSSTCSVITRAMSCSTQPSRSISALTSRVSWRYGVRTIRSSSRWVPRRSNATIQVQTCAFLIPDTSRWRPMPRKLPEQCASSLRAGLDDSERIADWGAFSIASEALGLAIGSPFTVFVSLSLSDSRKEETMPQPQHYDFLILGSGQGGKRLAWHLAGSGHRVVVVERRWVGGSCPAVACLPSKNEIWSARVAHLARHAAQFGTSTGAVAVDMAKVRRRKQDMVDREIAFHLNAYKASGAELIMGSGRFVGPRTIEVALNDGGTRVLTGSKVAIDVGTHAAIPKIPGLKSAEPLTHIEVLELDTLPPR